MTRSSVRDAIDFQGVIEGCPDHQWLLTDALYETADEAPCSPAPRWVVRSRLTDASNTDAPDHQHQYIAQDRKDGWTVSATSASALAQSIRQRLSEA